MLFRSTKISDVIKELALTKINLSQSSLLEKNCIYLCELNEKLKLPNDIMGKSNPKSTTGRLDIFTRVITENGKEYDVKVIKILEFGAVVEFRPGKEVLLHISEIAWERVENVEKHLKIGDTVRVKYMGIDPKTKKQKVSRKILLERPKKKE